MNTEIKIGADIKSVEQKMDKVKRTIGSVSEAAKGATSMISKLTSSIAKVAKISAGVGGVVGTGTFVASEKSFRKFEHRMMEAFTLLPRANKQAFAQMKKDALEFSEMYGVSTEEVAAGMYQSLSAGISPKDLKSFMQTAQESAIAGVTDLKTSVDALTNIMNAYGQETYDVEYLSDVLFKGITMSKLTFEELSRYMYQAIPTAAALKLNIVDLVGSISALSATGTLTRVGATQFRQFLVELQDHGSQANTIFRRMNKGISFQQFIAEGGRILDVVESLRRGARAAGLDMANLFSSIEAGNAARQMDNFERFEAMIKETEFKSFGSKNSAYRKMEGTLQKSFDRMKATFFNFFTRIGDVLEPAFRTFYNFTDEISRTLREDIDWQGISAEFEYAWKVLINVAKGGTDQLTSYLKNELKLAVLGVYESVVSVFSRVSKFFAQVFSLDSNEFFELTDALVAVAKNFGMTLVDSLREHLPKIVTLFTPIVAFLQASIQSAIDSLNPFKDEDFDEIRTKKAEAFGQIGSKERDEALLRANDKDMKQGLEQYAQKNRDEFINRNNYQNKVLGSELNEQESGFDKFIYNAYERFDKGINETIPDFMMGKRVLSSDTKLVYDMTAKNILEEQGTKMSFDKLGGHYDIGLSLNDVLEQYFESQNISQEKIPLPSRAIKDNFLIDGYSLDLNELIDPDTFETKGLMQLRNVLLLISKNAKFLEDAFPKEATRNIVKGRIDNALSQIVGFEQMLLGTLYDAEVGMGLRNEITQETVQFQDEYNQAIEQLNAFAEELQVYEKNNAKNRDEARDAERVAARKQLGESFEAFMAKLGEVDISTLEPDSAVTKDIEEKRKAFLAKRQAFIDKYGQGISIEDPMMAEFGAFDLPKSPAQAPYNIKPLFREVVADSKQRIGAGGGTFSFASVQEKLLAQEKELTDATKDLTTEIKEFVDRLYDPFTIKKEEAEPNNNETNTKGIVPINVGEGDTKQDSKSTIESDSTPDINIEEPSIKPVSIPQEPSASEPVSFFGMITKSFRRALLKTEDDPNEVPKLQQKTNIQNVENNQTKSISANNNTQNNQSSASDSKTNIDNKTSRIFTSIKEDAVTKNAVTNKSDSETNIKSQSFGGNQSTNNRISNLSDSKDKINNANETNSSATQNIFDKNSIVNAIVESMRSSDMNITVEKDKNLFYKLESAENEMTPIVGGEKAGKWSPIDQQTFTRKSVDKQSEQLGQNDVQVLINSLNNAGTKIEYASNNMAGVLEKKALKPEVSDIYPLTF